MIFINTWMRPTSFRSTPAPLKMSINHMTYAESDTISITHMHVCSCVRLCVAFFILLTVNSRLCTRVCVCVCACVHSCACACVIYRQRPQRKQPQLYNSIKIIVKKKIQDMYEKKLATADAEEPQLRLF